MKTLLKNGIIFLSTSFFCIILLGCNTIKGTAQGMSQDVQSLDSSNSSNQNNDHNKAEHHR